MLRFSVCRVNALLAAAIASAVMVACGGRSHASAVVPVPDTAHASAAHEAELEQKSTRLELRVLERDAQIDNLQGQLDDARQEVVRAMAKLQTLASRAEAASGMAEAEIALQAFKNSAGTQAGADVAQCRRLLDQATTEFNRGNYGGALYLATQSKGVASAGQNRLSAEDHDSQRPGEVLFALPLRLQASGHANVREGPGTAFKIAFTLEDGAAITGHSYLQDWVRITDESGRSGWIFHALISKRPAGQR